MNAEFFEALAMLEKERGLPADYLLEKIKNAIVIAVKKDYEVEDENVSVVIEPDQGKFSVSLLKTVVEEVEDPATEISLEEAQQKKKSCKAGDAPGFARFGKTCRAGGEHPGRNLRRHGRRDREGRGAKRRDACRVISCSHFLFAARRGPW